MMKINNIGNNNINPTGKASKKGDAHGDFSKILENTTSSATQGLNFTAPIFSAPIILGISSEEEKRKKQEIIRSGKSLLHELNKLQISIVSGSLDLDGLIKAEKQVMEYNLDDINDSKLKTIIEEIKLRVAVEIAKYQE